MTIVILACISAFIYDITVIIRAVNDKGTNNEHKDSPFRIGVSIFRIVVYIFITGFILAAKYAGIL